LCEEIELSIDFCFCVLLGVLWTIIVLALVFND
jgi:hypothetical protein